ncbi:MAG: hypothetical protein KatS3mg111_2781 [Pirellulaceae bacterium]|nr:MAG: hypothetical protein KatS3mg111_2781 [Pirellulaceae bacterium]
MDWRQRCDLFTRSLGGSEVSHHAAHGMLYVSSATSHLCRDFVGSIEAHGGVGTPAVDAPEWESLSVARFCTEERVGVSRSGRDGLHCLHLLASSLEKWRTGRLGRFSGRHRGKIRWWW